MTTRTNYSYFFDGHDTGYRQLAYLDKLSDPVGKLTINSGGTGIAATVPPTNWVVWAFVFNGAASAVWSNGVSIATGNVGTQTAKGVWLGRRYTANDYLNPGAIAWFQRCGNAGTDVTNMWNFCSNRFNLP
jgi:hypothetical protein